MYRTLSRSTFYICSAIVAPSPARNILEPREETGWDRVVKTFSKDEFDELTPELARIYQTTIFTGFVGAAYGGFIHARDNYLKFIENNDATKFTDHLEAKRKLQDSVTQGFFKGAMKWSWRLALFGGMYVTFVTVSAAYRGEPSILDYVLGGTISGFLYRLNYGVPGVIVGATLGSFTGLFAGSLTMMILRFAGTDHDDIANWHKEQMDSRARHYNEAVGKLTLGEENRLMLSDHDKNIKAS